LNNKIKPVPAEWLNSQRNYSSMELNRATTEKLAELSKLKFSDQELDSIQQDLQQMIGFIEKLNEVDTTNVAPLTHIGTEGNLLREDEVKGSVDNNTALKNAPAPEGDFFTVPKVIKK
jgi:aspartyl-tRNA(Asn)/glutamyl-tRNA(Gln) amidotransferase subunit C